MKATLRSVAACLSLLTAAAGPAASFAVPSYPLTSARAEINTGSATVTVYHSETGQPLSGIPVTVRGVVMPDIPSPGAAGAKMTVYTDDMGNAGFSNLPEG